MHCQVALVLGIDMKIVNIAGFTKIQYLDFSKTFSKTSNKLA